MTSQAEESGQRNGQKLDDIVRDADEYYTYLKRKHIHETRLDVVVVGLVVWFASFAAIGFSAFALHGNYERNANLTSTNKQIVDKYS